MKIDFPYLIKKSISFHTCILCLYFMILLKIVFNNFVMPMLYTSFHLNPLFYLLLLHVSFYFFPGFILLVFCTCGFIPMMEMVHLPKLPPNGSHTHTFLFS